MEEDLVAPCGMNCSVCVHYLALKYDINHRGFHKATCVGCLPRGQHCLFLKHHCERLGNGLIRFCYACGDFPCQRLKALDKRYRTKYHMSLIDNLLLIQSSGIQQFLDDEEAKWRCPDCGGVICCHNGLCLNCNLETLMMKKTYHWGEN